MTNKPRAPAGWIAALERSEAQAVAGLTVSGDEVQQGLRDAIAWLEAKQGQATATPADAAPPLARLTPADAVARIRELRKGNVLPEGVTIRSLIEDGRA